jgi:hypothetical protein
MRFPLKTLALSALTVLGLGTAAQATDISISIRSDGLRQVADWERAGPRRGFHEDGYGHGRRFIDERRERRGHGYDDDGFRSFPERRSFTRVVDRRHGWGHEECRVIVKRRVNPWGDLVVKRIKICD